MLGRTNTGGGGGGGLNFKVIPNPMPSTAKENTIWVDTDTINNYYFSAEQPENMAEYDVWFPIGTSSTVAFSATKKNPIMVYPISAKQLISGVLVDKTAKSWQGGKWVDWIRFDVLYLYGDENELFTGGWTTTALVIGGGSVNAHPTVTRNETSMKITQDASAHGGIVHTANKVKLAGKKSLVFKGDITGGAVSDSWWRIAVWSDFGTNSSANVVAVANIGAINKTDTPVTVDISQLDSALTYYVGIATYGNAKTVVMKSLTLE